MLHVFDLDRHVDARLLLVRALIEHKSHADALAEADRTTVLAPYEARTHYLRGKALIALARLEEARDAFDLALALKPTMIEAMLLRREADRTLTRLGKAIGHQRVSFDIPPSLENLREVLTSGRSKAAIEALSAPSLADDLDAQLLLARFYGFRVAEVAVNWSDKPGSKVGVFKTGPGMFWEIVRARVRMARR